MAQLSMIPTVQQVLAIVFAFVLSAPIGVEREIRHKAAGLRTQVLVSLGSCLFTLISVGGAPLLSNGVGWDASRIAAQVVSGIGFIGAGVIWFNHDAVRGLTTAAAVWMSAAIGMACGVGMVAVAFLVVVAYYLLVFVCSPLFYAIMRRRSRTIEVSYEDGQGVLRVLLLSITQHGFESTVSSFRRSTHHDRREIIAVISLDGSGDMSTLMSDISQLDGVVEVRSADDDEV